MDYLRTDTCAVGFGILQRLKNALTFWEQLAGLSVGIRHCNVAHFSAGCVWHPAVVRFRRDCLAAVLLFLPMFWHRSGEKKPLFNYNKPDLKLSEIVVLLAIMRHVADHFLAGVPAVTPYDALVGIDLVAKFALLDGRLIRKCLPI
ncbi:MAG: hypothetical protein R3C26_26995 [Calditrichia bacterium]